MAGLMEMDHDGHDFALAKTGVPNTPSGLGGELRSLLALESLAEIIDIAE